jgi:ribose transport system substrate-binding protein
VKIWPIATAAVSAVVLVGVALGAEHAPVGVRPVAADRAPVRVGIGLKGLDNPFFVAIYEGARVKASQLGVRATVRSVPSSADVAGQAGQIRALVAQRNDCDVVNPITATNLVTALRGVSRPVVNIDSPVDRAAAKRAHVQIRTYIGTDDFAAGRLAGARMASLLSGGGDVALFAGLAGSVNSGVRLSGFERGIRGSRVRVVARATADYDRVKAEIAAERIVRAHPHISGFFAVNDEMALGIADAVRAAGKIGKIRIIGVDGTADALDAVRAGAMSATVSQYPYVMGEMAVEACSAAARGARLPARVDAPIALLTTDNVARAIAAFPKPFQPYSDPFTRLLRKRR